MDVVWTTEAVEEWVVVAAADTEAVASEEVGLLFLMFIITIIIV